MIHGARSHPAVTLKKPLRLSLSALLSLAALVNWAAGSGCC